MHTQERGFTLIEVLVALTIIAIALAAGVQASSTLINRKTSVAANAYPLAAASLSVRKRVLTTGLSWSPATP